MEVKVISTIYGIILIVYGGSLFLPIMMKGWFASFNLDLFSAITLSILVLIFIFSQVLSYARSSKRKSYK